MCKVIDHSLSESQRDSNDQFSSKISLRVLQIFLAPTGLTWPMEMGLVLIIYYYFLYYLFVGGGGEGFLPPPVDRTLTVTTDYLSLVKEKHAEMVPQVLKEEEFWTQFFQSQFFHHENSKRFDFLSKDEKFDSELISCSVI